MENFSVVLNRVGVKPNLDASQNELRHYSEELSRLVALWLKEGTVARQPWMGDRDSVGPRVTNGAPYDVLLAMDVLEHIEDDIGALSQWLTHVKSGGYVLVTTPRSLGPQ